MNNSLGDRMKSYERVWQQYFPPTQPIVVRCDGKAFHTFTKRFNKPFDSDMEEAMNMSAQVLLKSAQCAKLVYWQSDELTLVLVPDAYETQMWFGGRQSKIETVTASIVTATFNKVISASKGQLPLALFDARAVSLPYEEVINNLMWRYSDCNRNSVRSFAHNRYGHAKLDGKSNNQVLDMIKLDGLGIEEELTPEQRRGTCIVSKSETFSSPFPLDRVSLYNWLYSDCIYFQNWKKEQ